MKNQIYLLIFVVVAALTFSGLTYYYYKGFPGVEGINTPDVETISVEGHPAGTYEGAIIETEGRVAFDLAHENAFSINEINTLLEKLNSAGVNYEFKNTQEDFLRSLKYIDAMVIISPRSPYSAQEVSAIKDFVGKGGRLVLFSDPTRENRIESISSQFGVAFSSDYLYNIKENAGNYRHIFIDDFKHSEVTAELSRVTFFTGSSISSSGGVAFTSEATVSSFRGGGPHAVIAVVGGSVLAVADQSFMEQPFDRVTDNGLLISNIAGFIIGGERRYNLLDFPYFLSDVRIRYSNESLLDEALEIKKVLVDSEVKSSISQEDGEETIFLGFIDESMDEIKRLGELFVNGSIRVEGLEFDINSTAVIYLRDKKIWILSKDKDSIRNLITLVKEDQLKYNLATENLGFLTYEPKPLEEEVPEETEINETV